MLTIQTRYLLFVLIELTSKGTIQLVRFVLKQILVLYFV